MIIGSSCVQDMALSTIIAYNRGIHINFTQLKNSLNPFTGDPSRPPLVAKRQDNPSDRTHLILQRRPMCDKVLETHVWFRAELQLQTRRLAHLERALDRGLEVPTQRPRAVVGEEFEHV